MGLNYKKRKEGAAGGRDAKRKGTREQRRETRTVFGGRRGAELFGPTSSSPMLIFSLHSSSISHKFLHPPTISAHKLKLRVSKLFFMSY